MKKYNLLILLSLYFPSKCLTQVYWTEDFGTGSTSCNDTQFAVSYLGINGSWTMTQTGVNGNNANEWYISSTSSNSIAGSCETGCSGSYNQTLHLANIATSPSAFLFCPAGDCGPAYDDSDTTTITSKRIESPMINLTGINSAQMSFVYIHKGQIGFDEIRLWFFNGINWVADTLLPQSDICGLQGKWTYIVINLPSFADNNPNFKVGFEWKNNGDGVATDPSFSIDEIRIANSFVSVDEEQETIPFTYTLIDNKMDFKINKGDNYKIELFDLTGKLILSQINQNSVKLAGSGLYIVRVWINGKPFTLKVNGL